jgi:hypothetical protein
MDFINDRLFDVATIENKRQIIPQVREEIEFVFLMRMLYGYFVIGQRNYQQMLEYFERMEVQGFQIGSTEFTQTSRFTREWQDLAREMESLVVENDLLRFVQPSIATDEVIRRVLDTKRI